MPESSFDAKYDDNQVQESEENFKGIDLMNELNQIINELRRTQQNAMI